MATLTTRNLQQLEERGIKVDNSGFGQVIELSTQGVAWLFNFLHGKDARSRTITIERLKELATWREPQDWRELRLRAVPCPAYDDIMYYSLVLYLNGTPPKMFTALSPNSRELSGVTLPANVVRLRQDQEVRITLSEAERERLIKGELLIAGRR